MSVVSSAPQVSVDPAATSPAALDHVDEKKQTTQQQEEKQADSDDYELTPLRTGVTLLSSRVRSNPLLVSSLLRLQSLLPAAVSNAAVQRAGQLESYGKYLGEPIVTKVDGRISATLRSLSHLPAYGSSTVLAADEFAYARTPDRFKPAYNKSKSVITTVVNKALLATEKVTQISHDRKHHTAALWSSLSSKVDHLSVSLASFRARVAAGSTEAVSTLQALHLSARLNALQLLVAQAVELARSQTDRARVLSHDLRTAVLDATASVSVFIDSSLTEAQREAIAVAWNRIQEGVASIRETLNGVRHANLSRSNSNASSESDASEAAAAAADESAASLEPIEPEIQVEGAQPDSNESAAVSAESAHAAEAESESSSSSGVRHRASKHSARKHHHGASAKKKNKQVEQEEKSKLNAEQQMD